MPRLVLTHLSGNPNSRNAARALAEAGHQVRVVSGLSLARPVGEDGLLRLLPSRLRRRIARGLSRRTWELPQSVAFHSYPAREMARLLLARTGVLGLVGSEEMRWVDASTVALDRVTARRHLGDVDAVFTYEDHACATFERAAQLGVRRLYELPIVHHRLSRRVMEEERERFPHFAKSLLAIHEPDWKIARKDRELELAEHLFVASEMVRLSAVEAGFPAERITLIPYGAPIQSFRPRTEQPAAFTALYVGLVGPRKGAHYLLEAWHQLKMSEARLRLVGSLEFPADWFGSHLHAAEYVGPVPHAALAEIYRGASVFVLPTLVEGSAMVILEALACGVPVITTPNAGGVVRDGVDGFIIPIRDVAALKDRLQWCRDHPDELAQMGLNARARAEELSWANYRQRLAARVGELLGAKPPAPSESTT